MLLCARGTRRATISQLLGLYGDVYNFVLYGFRNDQCARVTRYGQLQRPAAHGEKLRPPKRNSRYTAFRWMRHLCSSFLGAPMGFTAAFASEKQLALGATSQKLMPSRISATAP